MLAHTPQQEEICFLKWLIIVALCLSAILSLGFFSTASVSAHQSGCHRWHSCPSDSGSYTCCDTGYYSGCGGSITTYTAPVVDYLSLGRSRGDTHAVTKGAAAIESSAQFSASTTGTADGKSGALKVARPLSSFASEKTLTFDTPQDPQYATGYTEGYKDRCIELYDAAYSIAYASAYTTAETAREAEEAKKKADENAIWGWLIFGGIAAWIIYAIVKRD